MSENEKSFISCLTHNSNEYALICFGDCTELNYHSCCTAVLLNGICLAGFVREQTGNKQIYGELCQVKGYA